MAARRKSPPVHHHRSERIEIPDSGNLRIAVISDTHSDAHERSLELVAALKPDLLLHAGDIGDLGVLKPFEAVAPLFVVRGNIDGRDQGLADSIDISFERDGESRLKVLLMHIAVYGPKLRADARALAQTHDAAMVVCGHSHVPFIGRDRGVGMFNPGSIGPRRSGLPVTFGVLELSSAALSFRHMSCETGLVWTP